MKIEQIAMIPFAIAYINFFLKVYVFERTVL